MLKTCVLLHFLLFGVIVAKNKERLFSTNIITPEKQQTSEFQAPVFRESTQEASLRPIHIKVGKRLFLLCRVQGNPTPVVYFYKKSKLLSNDNANELDISENSLRIKSAKLSDSGIYTCEANNSIGSTSLNFHVIVDKSNKEPYWLYPNRMKKILHAEPAGNTVKFVCQAGGAKPLTAKWYKGDKFIVNKDERMGGYKFQRKNQVIQLDLVQFSDVGQYTCVISNKFGSINHSYELDVAERAAHRPILVMKYPINKTAYVGEDVQFQCNVFSDPHPHMQWFKFEVGENGKNWNNSINRPKILLKQSGIDEGNAEVLLLKNVTEADSGIYQCNGSNYVGANTKNSTLIVLRGYTATQLPAVTKPVEWDFPIVVGVAVLLVVVIIIIVCCVLKRRRKKPLSMRSVYRDRYDEIQEQILMSNRSTSLKFAPVEENQYESEFSCKHTDEGKLFRESLPEGR